MEKNEIIFKLNDSKKLLESVKVELLENRDMSQRCIECVQIQESIENIEMLIKDLTKKLNNEV